MSEIAVQPRPPEPPAPEEASRERLTAEYKRLVSTALPARARREGWLVTEDHCFGRIMLDNAVGGAWRTLLTDRRLPAFRQLSLPQLREAVALAKEVELRGDPFLRELNAASLGWRGKPQRGGGGRQRQVRSNATKSRASGAALQVAE